MKRALVLLLAILVASPLLAAEPKWVWIPETGGTSDDPRYFRKVLELSEEAANAVLHVSCDNAYTAFLNGKQIGSGTEWQSPDAYNVKGNLVAGKNVIAIIANNQGGGAGLIAELAVTTKSGKSVGLTTDKTWLVSDHLEKDWMSATFEPKDWKIAKELGGMNAGPWNLGRWPDATAGTPGSKPAGNMGLPEGFVAELYATHEITSSVVCLVFNSKGQLMTGTASGGVEEVRLIEDKDNDNVADGFITYQSKMTSHGLCVIGSDVYCVGNNKLYLLPDKDGDGKADSSTVLSPGDLGGMAEHGPHGILHGPDGFLYIMLGNSSSFPMEKVTEATSPVKKEHLYWGNLLPFMSNNFMDNMGPPGGRVLRTDVAAKKWEVMAAGMRNTYDHAFSSAGELYGFDSDMEWDIGLPSYRQVRITHITTGSEFGWRTGSAKWKNYYADSTPPMLEVGRGSPTGVEVYDHNAFPEEFRDAQFHCDWALGKVLCVKPRRAGSAWTGVAEDFMGGKNIKFPVTDCVVGPDGALYISFGGRGTKGGIYRVTYKGEKPVMKHLFSPEQLAGIADPIAKAINQPQPLSAYGRAAILSEREKAGADWSAQLAAVARGPKRTPALRVKALTLLGMFADPVDVALLRDLSKDGEADVRAHATWRIGLSGNAELLPLLIDLLKDKDGWVLRRACEGLTRHPDPKAADGLAKLLEHDERLVRYHARVALLRQPNDEWYEKVFALTTPRGKAEALVTRAQELNMPRTSPQTIKEAFPVLLSVCTQLLETEMQPDEFLATQRAIGLLLTAQKDRSAIPQASAKRLNARALKLLEHKDERVAMEAAELLGTLGDPASIEPLVARVKNAELPRINRILYAISVIAIQKGWTADLAMPMIVFFANPGPGETGAQFTSNMRQGYARLAKNFSPEEKMALIDKLPDSLMAFALSAGGTATEQEQVMLRKKILETKDPVLQREILNKVAAAGGKDAFKFLETIYDEASPLHDVVLGHLMGNKEPGARKYLYKAMASANRDLAAQAVTAAGQVKTAPKESDFYYGLIAAASRGTPNVRDKALAILNPFSFGKEPRKDLPDNPGAQVEYWQAAYKKDFPEDKRRFPELAGDGYQGTESYAKLIDFLKTNEPKKGNVAEGKLLFTSTKCITCHSFRGAGQAIGPDLSDVSRRFDWRKMVEEIVHPSRVVDARYRQMTFITNEGKAITGFVSAEGDETRSVTDVNGAVTVLKKKDVAKQQVSDQSIMPQGLVDALKPEQIRDLLAYLESQP